MAWTVVLDDQFTRANTTASANPGSVGGSWIDNAGSVYSILSNKLHAVTSDASGYLHGTQLLRPSSENALGQRITAAFTWQTYTNSTARPALVARWQDANNYYIAVASPTSNTINLNTVLAGVSTGTNLGSTSYTLVAGHSYVLDFWVTGSSPTIWTLTLKDLTTSTQVSVSGSDSASTALQSAGRLGVVISAPSQGTSASIDYDEIVVYSGTPYATALTLTGPTSGTAGVTSSAFTVTPNGQTTAATIITPSDSSGGGTFSPTTATIASGSSSPVTFTYTPSPTATGNKFVSITNNQSLTNSGSPITYAVSAPTATAVSLSGPTSGFVGAASTNFTVTPNGVAAASTIITPSDGAGGGTFSPTTVTIPSSSSAAVTFTYTAANSSPKSISITNNQGLTNSGSPINYQAASVATTLTLTGPTTGSVSVASSNFTVTPNAPVAAATTITPSVSPSAGTFTPSTVTIAAGTSTPATFTYTPDATPATRTISITNNKSLTNSGTVSYGSTSVGISVSPTSVAANTPGQVITITGSGTSFSGSPFTLSGGYGARLQSQTVGSVTAGTATIDPGIYGHGTLAIIDGGSGASATLTVTPRVRGNINVAYWGDSITISDLSGGTSGILTVDANLALNALGWTVNHTTNQGHDSASTQSWLPSATGPLITGVNYYNTAIAAMTSAGFTAGDVVHIMLGTNDVRAATTTETRSALTASQHNANMAVIVKALVALGYKVVISKPIWTMPYANPSGGSPAGSEIWPYNCNDLYNAYWALDVLLCDGVNVFEGDTAGFNYFQQNPTASLTAGGIHPNGDAQNLILGQMWATAIANRYGAASGGSRWTY